MSASVSPKIHEAKEKLGGDYILFFFFFFFKCSCIRLYCCSKTRKRCEHNRMIMEQTQYLESKQSYLLL